jgi:hypothetical protein
MRSGTGSRAVLPALPRIVLLAVSTICALAFGSSGPTRPYRIPPNLLEYFKSRYALSWDGSLTSRVAATADGPQGSLDVYFKKNRGAPVTSPLPDEQADAIARAFLQNEASLLDISDMSEIRKQEFKRTDGETVVAHYQRYIGGILLFEESFRVEVDPAGMVTRLHATLVPTPLGLYQAADRTPITRERVDEVAHQALADQDSPTFDEPKLMATWEPPYVLWYAGGRLGPEHDHAWTLGIDASTGKIEKLTCLDTRVYIRAPDPNAPTPCKAFLKGAGAPKGQPAVIH